MRGSFHNVSRAGGDAATPAPSLERDVDGAQQMSGGVFLRRQHVDNLDAVRE
jgi:hypothetical protein